MSKLSSLISFLPETSRGKSFLEYCFAIFLVAAATGIRLLLEPEFQGLTVPYVLFFLSNAVVIRYTKKGPAILAIALSTFAADFFFLPPRYTLWSPPAHYFVGVVFVIANIVILAIAQNMRRAKEQAEDNAKNAEANAKWMNRSQEIAHLGSWELDLVTNRLTWSDEVYRIFGLQPQEFGATYEAFLDAVHPEDRKKVDDAYSGSVREGKDSYEIEHRVIRKRTGEIRIVHERCEPTRDATGRIIRSVGMVHDITHRKQAEEALRLSEERFRVALQNSPVVVFSQDRDLRYTWVYNPSPGFRIEEVVGKRDEELYGPEDSARFIAIKKEVLAKGVGRRDEVVTHRPASEGGNMVHDMTTEPLRDGTGAIVGVICSAVNITKRKQAEESVRKSEERLRRLIDVSAQIVWVTNAQGEPEEDSPSWRACTGRSYERWKGWNWLDVIHPEDRNRLDQAWRHAVATRSPYEIEFRMLHHSGEYRYVVARAAPLMNADGSVREWIGMNTDIHERKQAEANQVLLTETLRVLNRSGDLHSLIKDCLRGIREMAGFDAVGLRLREGDDCPYYEQSGFSEEFLKEENFLCAKRGEGNILRDAEGRPVLECTCGLVLSGRVDLSMSCFTPGGSFWTNRSTDLLALPREADPRTNPRNNCIHQGYQSVGLFPVRSGQEIIGTLQLNDRREGRFTPESLAFFENLAQNLGLALQRTLAEQAVRRGEALLLQAVRVSGLGVFEHDHLTGKIESSPLLREMSGFANDEPFRLEEFIQGIFPEDRERFVATVRQAHDPRGEGMFEIEYRIPGQDGLRWLSARSQTFFEGEGPERRPVRTIGAVMDVTERKEMLEALTQAKEQLSQHAQNLEKLVEERTAKLRDAMSDLEHFSYTLSHDMRAPLRAMRGFAEMLKNSGAIDSNDELSTDLLTRIVAGANRMDNLITDALDYTRAIHTEIQLVPVDLERLLIEMQQTQPNLQPLFADIHLEGTIPKVLGNETALSQCFANLLSNAIKYVAPGVKPRIRIWAEPRVHGTVRVWVEDNGIGIEREHQAKIFQMFHRVSTKYEGTGIGLALVRKNVEKMGGQIGLESEPGKGSRFWLELKAAPPSANSNG